MTALFVAAPKHVLIPRDYQRKADAEAFRLWDDGERGVLHRIFTGGGKTPLTCMEIKSWLERGTDYYAMIISYERDLVWQFAQEIYDFLGIDPGIEMADEGVKPDDLPRVTVASRATLLPPKPITAEQAQNLGAFGFHDVNWLTERLAKKFLRHLLSGERIGFNGDMGSQKEEVEQEVERLREQGFGDKTAWSRLHKFDWRKNWLVVYDEAHRHVHSLKSVGHIVDWFDQNPLSRRSGLTATPKRGDGISIGHKMFPGVAIDYPLFHLEKPCAVKQGWAVPYIQKYIEVEGVDFKSLKKIAGDFDPSQMELILGEEATLAKLVQPLLDLVDDRRTLIFSPGVDMAKNVAAFINARCRVECYDCGSKKWYPKQLVGDGAECACGRLLDPEKIILDGEQARSMNGTTNPRDRKQTYVAHQSGKFQFLSVCGLCREGYNDPDISCVAIFRPVSKKASSLAEQMKGRGCRPCRSVVPILNELLTPEERVEAIASSEKPNCLIVDLVGVTGLADCASTILIYADGLDDEVSNLAAEMLEEAEGDVEDAIRRAKEEIEAERARKLEEERRRQEQAANRAKAQAEVKYSQHAVGSGSQVDPDRASDAQYKLISFLGMKITCAVSPRKAGRIINMLKMRIAFQEVAVKNGISPEQWEHAPPSDKQLWKLGTLHVHRDVCKSGWDASQVIGAAVDPGEFETKKMTEIRGVADSERLTGIAIDIALAKRVLPADVYQRLVDAGRQKRAALVN